MVFEARQKRLTLMRNTSSSISCFMTSCWRAYVLIDLKIGKRTHQDLGQMRMYVNYFNRHLRTEEENHTIGIVLCTKRNSALDSP